MNKETIAKLLPVPEATKQVSFPTWIHQTARIKSIEDTFNIPTESLSKSLTENLSKKEEIEDLLISSSFFLPRDMLTTKGFKYSQITVLTGEEFSELLVAITLDSSVHRTIETRSDVSYSLLSYAKYVGASARYTRNNDLVIIFKLWFGEPPFNIKDSWYEEKQAARVTRLYNFCGFSIPQHSQS